MQHGFGQGRTAERRAFRFDEVGSWIWLVGKMVSNISR